MESGGNKNNISGNIFSKEFGFSEVNPFGTNFIPKNSPAVTNPTKRLNGYDSSILNNTTYEESDMESIDYRIKEKEYIIKDLESKIKMADNYGSQNEAFVMKAKRNRIIQELETLKKQKAFGNRVLGENMEFSHARFKEKMPIIFKIQDFISRKILARISRKINSVVTLSDSLERLSDINKSVNELIDINIPYGEKVQNYEKLTDYLNQANLIHSKISKTLGK